MTSKGSHIGSVAGGTIHMRDILFMLAPIGLIIYFVVYPDQFNALLSWAGQYIH
jgi:hypothetical protein